MNIPETSADARSLVWRTFRNAADEDYMFARQAALMRSPHQFAWSSQQALEKILKCALLINDRDIKSYGHQLTPMFVELSEFASDILPIVWCPPQSFPTRIAFVHNVFEAYQSFIARFDDAGDTGHRYRIYNNEYNWFDLHKLDECYFQIRRLAMPLSMPYHSDMTMREALLKSPNLQLHSKLHGYETKASKEADKLRARAFETYNFSFFPEKALEQGRILTGIGFDNSEISMALSNLDEHRDVLDWFVSKITLKKNDREELTRLLRMPYSIKS